MDQPPSNIVDIYKSQGWNDQASIDADIAAGGWKSKVPQTGSSGGGGNDLPNAPSILDFTQGAYASADEALKAYVEALKNQASPLDIYTQIADALGLPEQQKIAGTLREQIGNLEDTIKRVEPNVAATTGGSLVTQAQRAGMVEARRKPLLERLGEFTTGLGRISENITATRQDLTTRVQLFMEGQQQALKPFEVQLAAMNDRAARLVSGYSQDVQNQLTTLMAKWQRDNELADQEWQAVQDALNKEKDFQNELAKMIEQSKIDMDEYWQKQSADTGTTDTSNYYNTSGSQQYTLPSWFEPIG